VVSRKKIDEARTNIKLEMMTTTTAKLDKNWEIPLVIKMKKNNTKCCRSDKPDDEV
jgi:hypothetical protein